LRFLALLFSAILTLSASSPAKSKAQHPFPFHVNYAKSISPSAYSQKELDRNLYRYYQQWKKNYLVKETIYYRIASDKNDKSRTVSEGQGYGMMIIAYFAGADPDAKEIFDGLYAYKQAHPSTIQNAFMSWEISPDIHSSDSAFDGDADIAYALLLADKQWGSQGTLNYKKEALKIIDALLEYTIGTKSHLPLLGDWVEQNGKKYNQYTTRSSDFMISHFRTFYHVSGNQKWLKVIDACQKAIIQIQTLPDNKSTLVSDFLYFDTKKKHFFPTKRHFLEEEDNSYYYNACRIPWRIGTDALLNDDSTSRRIVQKMLYWIWQKSRKNPEKIKSGYHLDGTVIGDYPSAVFIAPFGVAAKTEPHMQKFLDAIYESVKSRHENYYEDSVSLLSQLVITNNYWDPGKD